MALLKKLPKISDLNDVRARLSEMTSHLDDLKNTVGAELSAQGVYVHVCGS